MLEDSPIFSSLPCLPAGHERRSIAMFYRANTSGLSTSQCTDVFRHRPILVVSKDRLARSERGVPKQG